MASQVGAMIRSNDLQDLGKLEQDLVYGEASTKDLLAYLQKRTDMSALDKVCTADIPQGGSAEV